jgi:hypothetical protein
MAALAMLAMAAGCALPPDTALPDWAASASLLVGQAAPADDAQRALREGVAVYLAALGTVSRQEVLTFRETAFAGLPPRAGTAPGTALAELGTVLRRARDDNPDPEARAYSAGQARVVEDLRLHPMIRAADPPLQVAIAALAAGTTDPAERAVLARIAEGHALIAARARGPVRLGQRETGREIRDAEEALLRAGARLPAREAIAAAAVAATVQP